LVVTDTAGNILQISSNNGTAFRVNALALDSSGAQTVTSNANVLGFGAGTGAASSASAQNTLVSDSNITATGASTTAVYAYNPTSSQTVGFTAYDASGAAHTTSITLENNTIVGNTNNANTIDQAIASINNQLQSSGDGTLSQITAVKADTTNAATGVVTQGIQFISSLAGFNVTLGAASTATSQQGIGTAAQQGTTQVSSAGSQSDISTAAGAATAVTAISNAVTALGAAQANVGKGENLLNYAVALAQTQVTNEAAAESRIRDADLAAEAANLSKAQILVQAGTAALAQANSAPQAILSLLK
jgi:flagellin